MTKPWIEIGSDALTIEDVVAVARGHAGVRLSEAQSFRKRIDEARAVVEEAATEGTALYGVTTGFGASCGNSITPEQATVLAKNLPRYHGCGVGAPLNDEETTGVLLIRLATLATGWSGVRFELLRALTALIQERVLPVIPSQGSVGASGDLTPLSYVAAVLAGEREVRLDGETLAATEGLRRRSLRPFEFGPKETLSIMNGTSVMATIACLAHARSYRVARLAAELTAMTCEVTRSRASHFDPHVFQAKPHPGTTTAGAWIWNHVTGARAGSPVGAIQSPYSLRCAPHVIGVLLDGLDSARMWLETEINGASDNPLIAPDGAVVHGGNFYGGHVALAADALKASVANVLSVLDRQLVLLNRPATNGGLPENLVAATGEDRFTHHGFKALEITVSALAAESLQRSMPASVFSRSTEGHNQDQVSMGSIAARDWMAIVEMTEVAACSHLIALAHAVDLRQGEGCGEATMQLRDWVRQCCDPVGADRRFDVDIAAMVARFRSSDPPTWNRS